MHVTAMTQRCISCGANISKRYDDDGKKTRSKFFLEASAMVLVAEPALIGAQSGMTTQRRTVTEPESGRDSKEVAAAAESD